MCGKNKFYQEPLALHGENNLINFNPNGVCEGENQILQTTVCPYTRRTILTLNPIVYVGRKLNSTNNRVSLYAKNDFIVNPNDVCEEEN